MLFAQELICRLLVFRLPSVWTQVVAAPLARVGLSNGAQQGQRGWSSDSRICFLQKLLFSTELPQICFVVQKLRKIQRWLPFKWSPRDKDDHKVSRGIGDMVRTVWARCDRRLSSNSQGGQICSLNTSKLMTGMPATCCLLGSQVGYAGGPEGFSLAHYVFLTMIAVTFSSVRPSIAIFGCWDGASGVCCWT